MNILTIRMRQSAEHGPLLPAEALSLLMGVSAEEVRALGVQGGAMPPQWAQAGRRRTREAQAHTGTNDLVSVLRYWAERDHGAQLRIEHVGGDAA